MPHQLKRYHKRNPKVKLTSWEIISLTIEWLIKRLERTHDTRRQMSLEQFSRHKDDSFTQNFPRKDKKSNNFIIDKRPRNSQNNMNRLQILKIIWSGENLRTLSPCEHGWISSWKALKVLSEPLHHHCHSCCFQFDHSP